MPLEVKDLLRACQEVSGLGLGVLLKGLSVEVGIHLFALEKQETNLIEVFMLQALTGIWELLVGSHEGPCLPGCMTEDCHMHLVLDVERKVFETIKERS